jgi:hypothetical protein
MTCERCGAGVPAGASTCPNCGAPVGAATYETRKVDAGWSEVEVPQPVEPAQPAYEPTVKVPEVSTPEPVPPVYTPLPAAASYSEPPRRSRVWQVIAGCIGAVLICCCLAVVSIIVSAIVLGGGQNWGIGRF